MPEVGIRAQEEAKNALLAERLEALGENVETLLARLQLSEDEDLT